MGILWNIHGCKLKCYVSQPPEWLSVAKCGRLGYGEVDSEMEFGLHRLH